MSSIHFLLVDDEKRLIDTVAERLRLRGATVDLSFSGTEALNRLKKCDTIDIVVLDIKMPDQDGIETLKRIKAKDPLVEVIILTGNATVQSAIDAIKSGAFGYLVKPLDMEVLLATANRAVSRKRDREEKILNVRARPYISREEKNNLISKILEE